MLIKVRDFTDSAFDVSDANMLRERIENALVNEDTVTIDFDGIEFFSGIFFNFSLMNYAKTYGKSWFDKTFNLVNLNTVGKNAYYNFYYSVLEHPRKFPKDSEDVLSKILSDID